ncbi:unnamed protein product, partial [Ixodes persulcatus]
FQQVSFLQTIQNLHIFADNCLYSTACRNKRCHTTLANKNLLFYCLKATGKINEIACVLKQE